MIGAERPVCVEGLFAANPAFLDMLAAASGRRILVSGGATGRSHGAALLTLPRLGEVPCLVEAAHVQGVAAARLAAYAARWRKRVSEGQDLPGSTYR